MAAAQTVPGAPVADGVGWISAGFVNIYAVRAGDETYLIDTGVARRARRVVRAFRKSSVPLSRVTRVLLTHHHPDHRGGAAYLLEATRAPLACHAGDAPFVDGRLRAPMPLLMRLILRTRPAPVATVLNDGDRVGPFEVVHVPGHTPGEVAFFDRQRRLLVSGDSVVEHEGRLALPSSRFSADMGQAIRSLDRLRGLDAEVLLPGHGVPVLTNVSALLEHLIRRARTDHPLGPPV